MMKCAILLVIAVCVFQAVQTLPGRERREEAAEPNQLQELNKGIDAIMKKMQTFIEESSLDTNILSAVGSNITALTNKAAELAEKVATAIRNAEVQPTTAP